MSEKEGTAFFPLARYGLDALRRVTNFTNGVNATATRTYDATGALAKATDFAGVATDYARDAQGNPTQEKSSDIGSRATQYDALGLPMKIVDALGQATTIERDVLGRPTSVTYADGQSATLRYDLGGAAYNVADTPTASVGFLSEMTDRSGTTVYQRDAFGRVVRKTQTLANGMTHVLATRYTAAGEIDTVTYVGGNALFAVDPNGLQASQIAGRYGVIGGNSGSSGSRGGYDAQLDMYRPGSPSALERLANGVAKQCKAVRDWMFSEDGKSRNQPPGPLPEAEDRPHSIIESPGEDGQYTTHDGDGTGKQYRGSGQDHGGIPRPNVKEWGTNTAPDGRVFIDRGRVRPAQPQEIPRNQ